MRFVLFVVQEQSVFQLGVVWVMTEGKSVPGASFIAALEREAGVGDRPEGRGVLLAILASGVLDQRFQTILGTDGLGVRSRRLGLSGQAECLSETEMRIAVIRGGVQGGAEMTDRGRGVVPSECQSTAQSGQCRVNVARRVRANQRLRMRTITPVEGNQGSDSEDVGVGWGKRVEVRVRLVQTAESPETLGERES